MFGAVVKNPYVEAKLYEFYLSCNMSLFLD
jgi:hypothetical protein